MEYGISNMNEFKQGFEIILKDLDQKKVYKMLFRWKSVGSNYLGESTVEFNTSPSFFIYKNVNIDVLLYKFSTFLNVFESRYGFGGVISLDVFIKEWISESDFKTFSQILTKIKENDKKSLQIKKSSKKSNLDVNDKKSSFFKADLNKIANNSVAILIKGVNYGLIISDQEKDEKNYNKNFSLNKESDTLYSISIRSKRLLVKVTRNLEKVENMQDTEVNKVCVYIDTAASVNTTISSSLDSWTNTIKISGENTVVERVTNSGFTITFENNVIIKVDQKFNSKKLLEAYQDFDQDTNIGVIDIETYLNENNEAIPYAIGFKSNKDSTMFYLDSYNNPYEMILDCLNKMLVKENHNFKFYAHNMSQFDGIIILKTLMNLGDFHDFTFNVKSNKDGRIISLEIVKKFKAQKKIIKILILDSFLLLPFSLNKLATFFNCEMAKGIFPYKFINANNINYSGPTPSISYFQDLSKEDYLNYCNLVKDKWDCKVETLSYLEKDLDLLYNIIHKFNNEIFKEFKINITRVRTISGLAFLIYSSNFYKPDTKPIYFTAGKIEEFIRKAYYGGIVDVNTHYTDYDTYKYDVNSHYPNAMLMPMPGGKPRISTEKDLNKIFGFVEAKVVAPTKEELKVPILPVKIEGKTTLFRGTVEGFWWSEELKMARDLGYKIIEIKSCVIFDKVEGVFEEYVKTIYDKKLHSEKVNNDIKRLIYKLLLNSLYGRLGIIGNYMELKIIKDNPQGFKISKALETENSDVLYQANDYYLIKSQGPLDPEILNIINKEKLYKDDKFGFNNKNKWKGVSSSVQYSAAITAYARMNLNKFKNIPDNHYIGGDTDSIILTKPLEDKYIGSSLGLFKLEYVIVEGFYLQKKFYMLITKDNRTIIRAKGINNNKLLNYNTFLELFKGKTIHFTVTQISKNYKTLNINILISTKEIKGLIDKEINYKILNRAIGFKKNLSIIPYKNLTK